MTIGLLKSAILSQTEAIGFLIDGFPRELSQAHMFESQVGHLTCYSTAQGSLVPRADVTLCR